MCAIMCVVKCDIDFKLILFPAETMLTFWHTFYMQKDHELTFGK